MNFLNRFFLISIFSIMITVFSSQAVEDSGVMDGIAEEYVKLVLKIGLYDGDFVDAYYGPPEWRPAEGEKQDTFPHLVFNDQLETLISRLNKIDDTHLSTIAQKRKMLLGKQLIAIQAKTNMIAGRKLSFNEESSLLYDAVAPRRDRAHYDSLLSSLDSELPGEGALSHRFEQFISKFVIPEARLNAVFQAAIAECRKRTLKYIPLPENENFTVEYVTDKAWSGYNWFKGNSFSLIQLNTDLPIYIERAIDLAAHEGYPGHHVFNVLLEQELYLKRGWVEFSLYPLFSPQSLIAEGSANYGKEVVMSRDERLQFERAVLFPLAGLDPEKAEKYYSVLSIRKALGYAGNEAARDYLDGRMNAEQAVAWLIKYSLMSPEGAKQRIKFIQKYRSYVINYNLGEDIVRNHVEKNVGRKGSVEKRWQLFAELLAMPETASYLEKKQ